MEVANFGAAIDTLIDQDDGAIASISSDFYSFLGHCGIKAWGHLSLTLYELLSSISSLM